MYFDEIGKKFGLKELQDWYSITGEDVKRMGIGRLLKKKYNNSLKEALLSVYPDHEWLEWRIPTIDFFSLENQVKYLDWLGKKLQIKNLEDWYHITKDQIGNFVHPIKSFAH